MRAIKEAIKRLFPSIPQWRLARVERQRAARFKGKAPSEIFSTIYQENVWGSAQSISGTGSELTATRRVRQTIEGLIDEMKIKRLLDAPCGDFNWMKEIQFDDCEYIGADIVPELIFRNQSQYETSKRRFIPLNIIEDPLPQVDLILCRDCLFHLSYDDIFSVLKNFEMSGSTYLLTTTFPVISRNYDMPTGGFRPINLAAEPFSLKQPLQLICEQPDVDKHSSAYGKSLGLWHLPVLS